MLNVINWNKPLQVNGVEYDNAQAAYRALKDFEGQVRIKLNVSTPSETKRKVDPKVDETKYIFQVPSWFAKRNVCTTRIVGSIVRETMKAYKVEGEALVGSQYTACIVCGRALTNEQSKARGIGPVCASRFGWVYDTDDSTFREQVHKTKFSIWIPKSIVVKELFKE